MKNLKQVPSLSVGPSFSLAPYAHVQLLTQKIKTLQGLRINQVKYQIIRQFEDEASSCYTVYGKKVRVFPNTLFGALAD